MHFDCLLRGFIYASPGVVVGKVKIVLSPKDAEKFEKGDILVINLPYATPYQVPLEVLIPLLKKAGGVITDEWGMTSNVAVFCREVGIPCVVRTEKATKVLKDGDTVIVDGTKGAVYLKK
jgi:pyruvate,water dikinase